MANLMSFRPVFGNSHLEWETSSIARPEDKWLIRYTGKNEYQIFFPAGKQGPKDCSVLAEETLQDAIDFCNEAEEHPSLVTKIAEIYDGSRPLPADLPQAVTELEYLYQEDGDSFGFDGNSFDYILLGGIALNLVALAILYWLYR